MSGSSSCSTPSVFCLPPLTFLPFLCFPDELEELEVSLEETLEDELDPSSAEACGVEASAAEPSSKAGRGRDEEDGSWGAGRALLFRLQTDVRVVIASPLFPVESTFTR